MLLIVCKTLQAAQQKMNHDAIRRCLSVALAA